MARQIRKKSGTGIYHVIKERSALPLAPARTDPVIAQVLSSLDVTNLPSLPPGIGND